MVFIGTIIVESYEKIFHSVLLLLKFDVYFTHFVGLLFVFKMLSLQQ